MTIAQAISDNKTIKVKCPASVAIARGDLCALVSNLVQPASARTDLGSTALNQADFAPLFLGVMQDTRLSSETTQTGVSGNSDRVLVTDGVFDCSSTSATWEVGDLVAIDRDSGNSVNYTQQVIKTTDPALAIGVCIQRGDSITTVRCRLQSRIANDVLFHMLNASAGQGYSSAAVTLSATRTLTVDSAPTQALDPNGADRTVTLPAVAESGGLTFKIDNTGSANNLSVQNAGATVIGTVGPGESGMFWCDGATWFGLIGIPKTPIASANQANVTQTQTALTDNSGGSASTTLAAVTNSSNAGSADVGPVKDAIASLAAELALVKADIAALIVQNTAIRAGLVTANILKGGA